MLLDKNILGRATDNNLLLFMLSRDTAKMVKPGLVSAAT